MPDHVFLFSVRLPSAGRFDEMVADLTSNVLTHLGFTPDAIEEISGELRSALPSGAGGGDDVTIQFQADGGQIEIVASQNDRRSVHITRRLP